MTTYIPEVSEMLDAARRYVNGDVGLPWLHGYIAQCECSSAVQADPAVRNLVAEWRFMINNTWNEWGLIEQPFSQEDFKDWIKTQLQ